MIGRRGFTERSQIRDKVFKGGNAAPISVSGGADPEPLRLNALSLVPHLAPSLSGLGASLWGRTTPLPQPGHIGQDAGVLDISDSVLKDVLTRTRVIAVVGISPNPARPSHAVALYLQAKGYRVIPVNPGHAGETLLGETVHADLSGIAEPVDMVDIFRRSEAVPGIVTQALTHLPGLRTIWMQIGVEHAGAAAEADARGITVIQNRCPKIEYRRLFGDARLGSLATGGVPTL